VFNTANFKEKSNRWLPLTVLLTFRCKYLGSRPTARMLKELHTSYMYMYVLYFPLSVFNLNHTIMHNNKTGSALRYKLKGRVFDSRLGRGIFRWLNTSGPTVALGSTQPLTETSNSKCGRCAVLITLLPSYADYIKILKASASLSPKGLYRDWFTTVCWSEGAYSVWAKRDWNMYKACPSESGTDKFMQRFI
jgi:hypothetical protein